MLVPAINPPFPLRWGFTTRDEPGEPGVAARLNQVHGCRILEAVLDGTPEADGLWTTTPGQRIGIRVADCVPILLAGRLPDGRPWVAALHAGWRGATGFALPPGEGILRQGVGLFRSLGGNPSGLAWALGPAIRFCHFEVGDEVVEAARMDSAWRDDLLHPGPRGRAHLDLHGFLRAQALDLGLAPGNDGSVPYCTFCRPDLFWSWRRGDQAGRQWGLIEILPEDPS